jgi:hypothetical protein
MSARVYRWRLPVLILVAILCGFGCNPLMLPYLFTNMDPRNDPQCKLSSSDKEVKVVVLAYAGAEPRPELLQVDRALARKLTEVLRKRFEENSEKVKIIPPSQVDSFKDRRLDWRTLPTASIGKHFDADYVINLELGEMSLFEKGSFNTLYRGHATMSVAVVDVNKPEGEQVIYNDECHFEYPGAQGPVPASEGGGLLQFRQRFVDYMADHLSRYFSAWPERDRYDFR